MPGIDKWPDIIQWVAGIGVLVGGALAGFFGTKIAGRKSPDDDRAQAREDERERVELKSQAMEGRLKVAFEEGQKETRREFYKTFEKYHNDLDEKIGAIDDRVRLTENQVAGMRADVEGLKARRPR